MRKALECGPAGYPWRCPIRRSIRILSTPVIPERWKRKIPFTVRSHTCFCPHECRNRSGRGLRQGWRHGSVYRRPRPMRHSMIFSGVSRRTKCCGYIVMKHAVAFLKIPAAAGSPKNPCLWKRSLHRLTPSSAMTWTVTDTKTCCWPAMNTRRKGSGAGTMLHMDVFSVEPAIMLRLCSSIQKWLYRGWRCKGYVTYQSFRQQ